MDSNKPPAVSLGVPQGSLGTIRLDEPNGASRADTAESRQLAPQLACPDHMRDTKAVPGGVQCTRCGGIRNFDVGSGPNGELVGAIDEVLPDGRVVRWTLAHFKRAQADAIRWQRLRDVTRQDSGSTLMRLAGWAGTTFPPYVFSLEEVFDHHISPVRLQPRRGLRPPLCRAEAAAVRDDLDPFRGLLVSVLVGILLWTLWSAWLLWMIFGRGS